MRLKQVQQARSSVMVTDLLTRALYWMSRHNAGSVFKVQGARSCVMVTGQAAAAHNCIGQEDRVSTLSSRPQQRTCRGAG